MKMKIIIGVAAALGVAAVAAAGAHFINQKQTAEYKSSPLQLPDGFTYTAHTGCVDTKENSLESIETAVSFGADTVEFDLHFNENNEPVLSHDEPKGGEVTLDEAFKKISEYSGITVNVDIKSTAALETVKPLAEKYGILDRIFFTGVNDDFVEAVRNSSPDVPYYLNVDVALPREQTEEYLLSLVEKVKNSGAVGINFNKDNATKELVEIFHKNGLLVSIWTVSSEKEIYQILSLAPDNITTRRPDMMQKILSAK